MKSEEPVKQDERTVAIENAAFKWAYTFLFFGLLLDWLFRHRIWNEGAGDLVALLCGSVAVITVFLIKNKAAVVLPWRKLLISYALCALVAVVVYLLGALFHTL